MPGQRAGGIGQYFEGAIDDPGRVLRREVLASTCSHCAAITEYPSQKRMLEFVDICRGCMRLICLGCVGKPCDPVEAKAERAELETKIRGRVEIGAWRCY